MRSRALEAPRPFRSKRRFDRRSRRSPRCAKTTRTSTHRTATPPSPPRPVENARPGWRSFRSVALGEEVELRHEMQPIFQANNPLFKERVPDLHVAYRCQPSLRPEGARRLSRFMALHSLRIIRVRGRGGIFLRLRTRTGFPLTLLCGPLPAGPHERCRSSHDPERLPSVSRHRFARVEVSSLELGPTLRRGRDHGESERARHRS